MAHPFWHLFDLVVRTPRLELRYLDDAALSELVALAADGIHDPSTMPFGIPWTDIPSPRFEEQAMQFHWRCRADVSPTSWNLNFAARVDGELVGTTGLFATDFPTLRTFETGSWLGRRHQGRGIGTEMRAAVLHLGFDGFAAAVATTAAWHDNGPSLGVTRRLGYQPNGSARRRRRDVADTIELFQMSAADFAAHVRRDDVEIDGLDACLPILGLDGQETKASR